MNPFPSTSSLLVVHRRERHTSAKKRHVFRRHRNRYDAMGQRLDHWELGFSQFWLHLYLRTGLAVHPHTDLLVELLSQHAPFPFVFPRQVGWVS